MGKQYYNGVLYGTGEIIKFSPYIYSLEEREVGVWTDGKPLYQKTYALAQRYIIASGASNFELLNLPLNVAVVNGFVYDAISGDNNRAFHGHFTVASHLTSGYLFIRNNSPETCGVTHVTIQYTKTTDTPGSGHYTTKGGEAHHYSTSEQIVGTWIDGKPLYEKTIVATMTSSTKKLELSSECVIHSVQGGVSDNSNNKFVAFGFVTTSNDYVRTYQEFEGGTNGLYVQNSYYSTRPKVTAIIQYTKTTD